MKILLIEDEIFLQEIYSSHLSLLGFEVKVANSVETALDIYWAGFQAEIIIADINLAGPKRGHEIIDELSLKTLISPDVVLITGGNDISNLEAIRQGARKLINKPFKFRELAIELQEIILLKNLSERMIESLFQKTMCHSIGVRIKKGLDFPYLKYQGFADSFIKQEKYLCARNDCEEILFDSDQNPILECMCGNIIKGRFDPTYPFFTNFGSFYSNGTTKLLASTSSQERQARTRNFCNQVGYESVALIPIKNQSKTFGLFQINDFKENMFTHELISEVEKLATDFASQIETIV